MDFSVAMAGLGGLGTWVTVGARVPGSLPGDRPDSCWGCRATPAVGAAAAGIESEGWEAASEPGEGLTT